MVYEEDDDAEDVKAGSFYTTPNGNNTSFSFFREDDEQYYSDYPYKEIDIDKIKYVMKDGGYNPAETDTPEFAENLKTKTPCNQFVTSVFDKERFLYFLQYGIMYISEQIHQKHIMRYLQFFATRKIVKRLDSGGKGGIIWHTQGSGKTALAAFSNRVIRDYYAKNNISTRFFFVVDRLIVRTNLIESYELLMEFIAKHTLDKFALVDNIRTSVRDLIAREVVSNILVHRDFSSAFPAKVIVEKD